MELIQPAKQKVWGWPGVVNFALGGAGSGSYLLGELMTRLWQGGRGPAVFRLLGPGACATRTVPGNSRCGIGRPLSLIHISEPTRLGLNSYSVFCLKKKKLTI